MNLRIKLADGTCKTIVARVTNNITCPTEQLPLDLKKYPVLAEVQLADQISELPVHQSIDVLVGVDYYHQFIHAERIQVLENLILVRSEFGYIPTGLIGSRSVNDSTMLVSAEETNNLEFDLKRFWELEQIGINDPSNVSDEESAMQHFHGHLSTDQGRYIVSWPWKNEFVESPPDNYQLALGRLRSQTKRMAKTPDIITKYNDIILNQLNKGIIEVVEDTNLDSCKVHYLPHHAVLKDYSNTTKVRVVFDASAKQRPKTIL